MIINNNISAIFANRQANIIDRRVSKDMEQLSSGIRINSGSDDASGLAVSEKMRTQIRGINQAMRNTQDANSFIQTTEGYLQEVTNALQRIRELSVQGANGIYTDEDRGYLNVEIGMLVDEIDRISKTAQFNTMSMLNGRFAKADFPGQNENAGAIDTANNGQGIPAETPAVPTPNPIPPTTGEGMNFHIGPNQDNNLKVFIRGLSAQNLELCDNDNNLDIGTTSSDMANISIGKIDKALGEIISQRTELGAYQNRLQSVYQGLYIAYENTSAAESRIRDTDMARGVSKLVKNQILQQASVSMLAQANLKPQMILSLLQ